MNNSPYIILGPRSDSDAPTYWSNKEGWTEVFGDAEPYDINILSATLPRGATSVMPFSLDGEPLGQYTPLSPLGGMVSWDKVF